MLFEQWIRHKILIWKLNKVSYKLSLKKNRLKLW